MSQDPDAARREGGGVEGADLRRLRARGGPKLPGLTQRELAYRVGVPLHHVQRVEQGRRGCNPKVAQKMADALEVDLQELRAEPDEEEISAAAQEARPDSRGEPPSAWLGSPRYLHQAYLKVLLQREFGSAYLVLDEKELESHVEGLPVEEEEAVVVVIRFAAPV